MDKHPWDDLDTEIPQPGSIEPYSFMGDMCGVKFSDDEIEITEDSDDPDGLNDYYEADDDLEDNEEDES